MSSGAGVAFAGALQASLSVLLTITVGVVSAQYGLLSIEAAEDVSRVSVQVFLPCLLIENLGRNLNRDTAEDYVPLISKPMDLGISMGESYSDMATNHMVISLQ